MANKVSGVDVAGAKVLAAAAIFQGVDAAAVAALTPAAAARPLRRRARRVHRLSGIVDRLGQPH